MLSHAATSKRKTVTSNVLSTRTNALSICEFFETSLANVQRTDMTLFLDCIREIDVNLVLFALLLFVVMYWKVGSPSFLLFRWTERLRLRPSFMACKQHTTGWKRRFSGSRVSRTVWSWVYGGFWISESKIEWRISECFWSRDTFFCNLSISWDISYWNSNWSYNIRRFSKCFISWNFIGSISSNIISSPVSFGPSTPVQSASAAPAGLQSFPGGFFFLLHAAKVRSS